MDLAACRTLRFVRLVPVLMVVTLLLCAKILHAQNSEANAALQEGRADDAIALLRARLATQPDDAEAHQLLCRVYYAEERPDEAIGECERAVANAPSGSADQMWLGRAYGMKASRVLLTALPLAKKVRIAFERAVQLNGSDIEAMSDLGEFYVEAPGMVGGGLDKAAALADRMQPLSAEKAHRLRARIAQKQGDQGTAEREFEAAVAAGKSAEAYVDLGRFHAEHGRPEGAVTDLQAALGAQHANDAFLVDVSSLLTSMHRSPDVAVRVLQKYLASPAKTDEAPAFKVHVQLGRRLAEQGDAAGAYREYKVAVAMASGYAPAKKALQGQ
jgi:tetratricopeptide (TPR) repeat protein